MILLFFEGSVDVSFTDSDIPQSCNWKLIKIWFLLSIFCLNLSKKYKQVEKICIEDRMHISYLIYFHIQYLFIY